MVSGSAASQMLSVEPDGRPQLDRCEPVRRPFQGVGHEQGDGLGDEQQPEGK